jgi:hypothetical protein
VLRKAPVERGDLGPHHLAETVSGGGKLTVEIVRIGA